MLAKRKIGIVTAPHAGASPADTTELCAALSMLFPVEFCYRDNRDWGDLDGAIVFGEELFSALAGAAHGVPAYVVCDSTRAIERPGSRDVRIGTSEELNECLRGRVLDDSDTEPVAGIELQFHNVGLADKGGEPIWVRRRIDSGWLYLVALAPPRLEPGASLYDCFRGGSFLSLLPLLHFLIKLTQDTKWQAPPVPACLVIDDPSLYAKTYGYVDFSRLASDTLGWNYFVAIATIPIDCWRLNRRVVDIFRANRPRLSLLVHGNNHTFHELRSPRSSEEDIRLLAQALNRWTRLEAEQGLEICRVMEAPHGSIAERMFALMAALGYEAVLGGTELLLRANSSARLPRTLGLDRTCPMRSGFAVIPRIRASKYWKTDVLLAAFLQQPVVLVAHHWDFARSMSLPHEFADLVNSLPGLYWSSPRGIVQSSYKFRHEGEVLHVKMYSARIQVPLPEGVRFLVVHRPWLEEFPAEDLLTVATEGGNQSRFLTSCAVVGPMPVVCGTTLVIENSPAQLIDSRGVTPPRSRYWPVVRKVLMEVRDRSAPWLGLSRNADRRSIAPGTIRPN